MRLRRARHWNGRQKAATSDRELADVMVDRAKSAAVKAERRGDKQAWYSLAQTLDAWCREHEA
ncbi:hypothetical protein EHYA_07459 [Embleya hyalina]|uniref:Uncharacterized protein n=2 Tax=Embleya hyalina TaxID=516124 RepID=A0A401YYR0_9ACTN|nr:hypothetical protein EHYA_07459 [Embleya hyalina]